MAKTDKLSGELVTLLRLVYNRIISSRRYSRDVSIMNPKMLVLRLLVAAGDMTISEIASHLSISRPNMTAIVDSLETRNWVARKPAKGDRRKVYISITAKGRKAWEQRTAAISEILGENLQGLTDDEKAQLHSSAKTMNKIMSKVKDER